MPRAGISGGSNLVFFVSKRVPGVFNWISRKAFVVDEFSNSQVREELMLLLCASSSSSKQIKGDGALVYCIIICTMYKIQKSHGMYISATRHHATKDKW